MVDVASLDLFNMTKFIIRCWMFNAYSPPWEDSMFDVHEFLPISDWTLVAIQGGAREIIYKI